MASLAMLLPQVAGLDFTDAATFEQTYQAYKAGLANRSLSPEEQLAALELSLHLSDKALTQLIKAQADTDLLLKQLIEKYPLARASIQARFDYLFI